MITCEARRFSLSAHGQISAEVANLNRRRFWLSTLFLTGTLGLTSGLLGAGISAFTLVGEHGAWPSLDVAGTVLVASAFPLLMLAAHAMDKIGALDIGLSAEQFKRSGLSQ